MSRCEDLQPTWPVLLGLPADDPELETALAHASGCQRCATEVRGSRALLTALDSLGQQPPSRSALARAAAPILDDLARQEEARRKYAAVIAAAASLAGFALLVAMSQSRAAFGPRWEIAFAFAAVAAGCTAAAVLFRLRALWAILPISAAMAVAVASSRGWDADGGLRCALGEGIGASLPLAALSYLLLRKPFALGPSGAAAAAAGGALAGQAALVLTCPSHGIEHLVVFHAGTVALAAMLGYLWGQRPLIAASARA
jgi:hypothetical protein